MKYEYLADSSEVTLISESPEEYDLIKDLILLMEKGGKLNLTFPDGREGVVFFGDYTDEDEKEDEEGEFPSHYLPMSDN